MRIEVIDLHFQGSPHVIASFLVHGPVGHVLIETGPASCLEALQAGLERHGVAPADVRDVLVTHIHLDHAGAAGWWAQQGARVWVHPNGAPHLIDPSRLLASAQRIYGDMMDRLWGEVLPAPADLVHAVEDGATIEAGGLEFRVVETPGHANHHHVYLLGDVVFTGDAAGIQLPDVAWVDLPAPPPEFDLEGWQRTLVRLREAKPRTLYRTHYGPGTDVDAELDRFEEVLIRASALIRDMRADGMERPQMVDRFTEAMREMAGDRGVEGSLLTAYELANPRAMTVDGISRYWRKREQPD